MLLAQALFVHVVGREFRYNPSDPVLPQHRQLLGLFGDSPSNRCPFSVHNLLRHAGSDKIQPGTWLGPSSVCRAMCRAINQRPCLAGVCLDIAAYLAVDAMISRSEVMETIRHVGHDWCPVLILVPLRLGVHKMNADMYLPALQQLLSHKRCVGIIGGKPKHSLFFMGFQGDEFIGLDPHNSRSVEDVTKTGASVKSYHCTSPRKVACSQIDPSIAIGFFCSTPAELDEFCAFSVEDSGAKAMYSVEQ